MGQSLLDIAPDVGRMAAAAADQRQTDGTLRMKTRLVKLNEQQTIADEITPALRLLLETVRRALLQICAAIEKYLGRSN
jgi:hypothetical protein